MSPTPLARPAADRWRCPVCGAPHHPRRPLYRLRFASAPLEIYRCGCGIRYSNHALAGSAPDVYDASYYEHLRYTGDAARDAYVAHLAGFFDEAVRRWGSPAGSRRLLDVGCATGDFVAWAGQSGWDAEGLDVSAAAVSTGRARGLRLRIGGVDDLAQQGAAYDAITLWDVLEHLSDPTGALRAISAALRPGGLFLLKTVSCRSIVDALASAAYRASGGLAQGALRRMYVPGHLYYYTPKALARHLAENGWEVILARQADTPPQALFRSRALRAAFTVVAAVQAWTGRCYELFAACRKAGQSG